MNTKETGEPRIFSGAITEIINNKRIVVDGCDGVLDYSDEVVIIKSNRLKITILGRDLKLKILTENAAVIEGYIVSVNFGYI